MGFTNKTLMWITKTRHWFKIEPMHYTNAYPLNDFQTKLKPVLNTRVSRTI